MKIYQYHPTKIPVATRIEATSPTTRIHFFVDTTLVLDSRYDHKKLAFETTPGIDSEESIIKVVQRHTANDELTVGYDIPLAISNGWITGVDPNIPQAIA